MVLSVDIGSSRTHVAAVDVDTLRCIDRYDSDNREFDAGFGAAVKNILSLHPQICAANISSCVRNLAVKAKDICGNELETGQARDGDANAGRGAESVRPHGGLPVSFKYKNPGALGTDRVCNALACAALFKGRSCVIIDAGTAITVDCLRDGKIFEGGAILAGCGIQLRALHDMTDSLPLIDIGETDGINIHGSDTADCIKAGVLYGTAGAVGRCVAECLRYLGGSGDVSIVATGGGWGVVEAVGIGNNEAILHVPDLTLIGGGIYYRP
jgi:pantothenate kinase type III